MKKIKNENGVITMVTLITVLFMVSFLVSSYILVANKVKTQKEMLKETKAIYEPKSTMEEVYNSYFSEEKVIPISTVEQLLAMGNNQKININEKIYTFSDKSSYILMNNLEFDADDWQHVLGENTDWTPIEETNLDFEWNGHRITVIKLNGTIINYGIDEKNMLPEEYQQVEYIESTGTQYIDTLIKANQDTKVEAELQFTNTTEMFDVFGSRTSATENNFEVIQPGGAIGIDFENYQNNRLLIKCNAEELLKKYVYVISNKELAIGLYKQDVIVYNEFETPESIYIFDVSGNPNGFGKAYARLYYFKMWNNNSLVRDFVPCYRKVDGKPGLYDLVNDVFYTNQGTGDDFIVGASV